MQRSTLGKSGSEAAWQLQGLIARAFSSNSLVNTMDMTILGLAGVLFCENEQAQTKLIIICSEQNTYLEAQESKGRS